MSQKLVYPDEGMPWILSASTNDSLTMKLFTNDITPDRDTVVADLTEAAWTGYAGQGLSFGEWNNAGFIGHVAFLSAPDRTFANTSASPVTTYGYWIETSGGEILVCSRFDPAPKTLDALTGELDVTPIIASFSREPA